MLLFGAAILAWACKPSETPNDEAMAIVQAISTNKLDEARNRANQFFASKAKLDSVDVSQLCALSIAMVRLSETDKHSDGYAAQALQCYRVAMMRDSITSTGYFNSLNQDDYQHYSMLLQLSAPVSVRESGMVYTVNEMGEDVIVSPEDTTSLQ